MSKSLLSADLVTTLKLIQTDIKNLRSQAVKVRAALKAARLADSEIKSAARAEKATVRAAKKAARIEKLEAKLLAMKVGTVGSIAIRTNKKPSACTTVYQMAA